MMVETGTNSKGDQETKTTVLEDFVLKNGWVAFSCYNLLSIL